MRLQGTITEWKDEQGFGFITPSKGGPRVFVHIKSFASRKKRPAQYDVVHYEQAYDAQGRPQAVSVSFEESILPKESAGRASSALFPALFLILVAGAVVLGRLPLVVLLLDLIASVVAFMLYDNDKLAAMRRGWRTPENTLHFVALIGGWPGAYFAQQVLRHKSSKISFLTIFRVTVMLNVGAHAWLLTPSGSQEFRKLLDAAAGVRSEVLDSKAGRQVEAPEWSIEIRPR